MDWNGQENLKSLVPTQSSQNKENKEKFSCPFQSTDNFLEWKLALNKTSDFKRQYKVDLLTNQNSNP